MDAAADARPIRGLDVFLAGLQAGLIGVLWMLAWLGMSSMLEHRGFWMPENLLSSVFYGNTVPSVGFSGGTLPGLALYILLYSVFGALFGLVVLSWAKPIALPRLTLLLAAVAWGLAGYWFTLQMLWKSLIPLAAVLHSRPGNLLGHVLYGTLIARFPAYLPRAVAGAAETEANNIISDPVRTELAGRVGDSPREDH